MSDTTRIRARLVIGISFFAMSIIGVGVVFSSWANQSLADAFGRSILFLVIMGCVHLVGYLLYVQQFVPKSKDTAGGRASFEFAPQYWSALKTGVVLQLVICVLTLLLLDMGRAFGFFRVALIAHWMGIIVIMGRRPTSPTKVDILFIRWGILPLFLLSVWLGPLVWRIIGESPLSGWERWWGR